MHSDCLQCRLLGSVYQTQRLLTSSFDYMYRAVDRNLSTFQSTRTSKINAHTQSDEHYTFLPRIRYLFLAWNSIVCACTENSLLPHRPAPGIRVAIQLSARDVYIEPRVSVKNARPDSPLCIRECTFSFPSYFAGENIHRKSITMNEKQSSFFFC